MNPNGWSHKNGDSSYCHQLLLLKIQPFSVRHEGQLRLTTFTLWLCWKRLLSPLIKHSSYFRCDQFLTSISKFSIHVRTVTRNATKNHLAFEPKYLWKNAWSEREREKPLLGYTPRACTGVEGFRVSQVVLIKIILKLYAHINEEMYHYVPEIPWGALN